MGVARMLRFAQHIEDWGFKFSNDCEWIFKNFSSTARRKTGENIPSFSTQSIERTVARRIGDVSTTLRSSPQAPLN